MRRATRSSQQLPIKLTISIHALHEESDQSAQMGTDLTLFQSTLSMRRATKMPKKRHSTQKISIHALHEESDAIERGKQRVL